MYSRSQSEFLVSAVGLNDLGALLTFSHRDQVICETFTDEVNLQTDL